MRKPVLLAILALVAALASLSARGAIPAEERAALLALYASTGGDGWAVRDNWLGSPGSECSWYGVECNEDGSHVISLTLSENLLTGPLPAELGNLTFLRSLRMDYNTLIGTLPATLTQLAELQTLDLAGNSLEGNIPPGLGGLTALTVLNLSGNRLGGSIPAELGGLAQLVELDLSQNLLAGPIPPSLGGLANLQILALYRNQLTGAIPAELAGLAELRYLYLAENRLQGGIPAGLGSLTHLREMFVSSNQLVGGIPVELGGLAELEILDLSGNPLGGPIPPALGSLSALRALELAECNLGGSIPGELGNLAQLRTLDLAVNALDGTIPPSLGGLSNLEWLDLSFNRLVDAIPPDVGLLTQLTWLNLAGNQLFGGIPAELGNLTLLRDLFLDTNLLGGPLPESLGTLTHLETLSLGWNQFEGGIPAGWFNLTQLRYLDLALNNLTGTLPPSVGNLQQLASLHLAANRFDGPIPPQLGSLGNLSMLDLQNNRFDGPVPPELGQLGQLRVLQLGLNRLEGPIPPTLGNLANLNLLLLIGNKLSGPVPSTLVNLSNLYDAYGIDLNFNALYTEDPALLTFLLQKHGMNFLETQTLAPAGLAVAEAAANTIHLTWTPMTYQDGEGGYEILLATTSAGPYTVRKTVGMKSAAEYRDCFCGIDGTVYMAVRGWSEPHGLNGNRVTSEPTPPLPVTPGGQVAGVVTVYTDPAWHASLFADSPSQILPSTYLTFAVAPEAFPTASSDSPAVIMVSLPPGALLSQTLADGQPGTASPEPTGGETVWDLAVSEYALEDGRPVTILDTSSTSSIGPHAVQMFRYFEGEGHLLIRINESTANWIPTAGGAFLGFTIGLGGGVWPPDDGSNWGAEGRSGQPSTQFYVNLGTFQPAAWNNLFPVQLCAFRQISQAGLGVSFQPGIASLLTIDGLLPGVPPAASLIGRTVTDFTAADLDGDGRDDICAVDGDNQRLYWAFGQEDGSFADLGWLATTGYIPVRVDAADVTGDGRADLMVADETGSLHIYDGADLFYGKRPNIAAKTPVTLHLDGVPSDALLADVSNDGHSDYLYTDAAADTFHVLLGNGFATGASYPTGAAPEALALGDFDGDLSLDVAVANGGGNSLSVFLNDGAGQFAGGEVAGVGTHPAALDAADFNRDGLADLAVVLSGDKAIGVLRAQSGGQFSAAQEQKIFFQKTPSAIQAENFDGEHGPDALVGFADDYKLVVCTSDSGGILAVAFSIDTRGDVEIDPLTNSVSLAADRVLSVAGGTSAGGVASRQGVAVIQDAGYGVLHFPRTKDLSFSVVNLDEGNALLTLELYNDQLGTPLSAATFTVAPGAQFARYLADLLGSDAGDTQRWARGFLTQSETYGLWLANNGADLTYLDGARLPDVRDARTRLAFPLIQTGGARTTTLLLVNPNKSQAQVVLRLYGADGAPRGGEVHRTLPGRGRSVLDVATSFPGLLETDSIQLAADRALLGVAMCGDSQALACLEALPAGIDQAVLYSPHVASGNFGVEYDSYLSLVNTGDTDATLAVTLANDTGTPVATVNLTVSAHGKQLVNVATLFNLQAAATGYLRINPGGAAGIVGCILFGESGTGRFVSSLPLQSVGHNRYLLGHIANGTIGSVDYFTGIAVLNPEQDVRAEVTVQISAYDQNGLLQDRRTITLAGRERRVFLLHQLMPELTSLFGGYIVAENLGASSGILVFELFGDAALQFLSAVPAIPLD